MRRTRLLSLILPLALLLVAACSDDEPTAPTPPSPTPDPLDLELCLGTFTAGDIDQFADHLHPDFRFVPTDADGKPTTAYDHDQQLAVARAMTAGAVGADGAVLDSLAVLVLLPQGDWQPTERDDPVGPHRAGALKCSFQFGLRAYRADTPLTWVVDGVLDAYIDTLDGESRLLGLVDHTLTARPVERVSWSQLQSVWLEPDPPSLPISPDWLSIHLVNAHDNRDWHRLAELIHPSFRDLLPDGSIIDHDEELAVFADFMAGRADTSGAAITGLDIIRWEPAARAWTPVLESDPHFGDLAGAMTQLVDVRIVYPQDTGETWEVEGFLRLVALETSRGWQLAGIQDLSHDTGDEDSVGWWEVKRQFSPVD